MTSLTLVLADDHPMVRVGLRTILRDEPGFEIVGEADNGEEAVKLVEHSHPDVLVLDLMLPLLSGLEVARQVRKLSPQTRVVVLSMHANEAYVAEALRAGAVGYVLKDAGIGELVEAIRDAAAGQRYFSKKISPHALDAYIRRAEGLALDPGATLTPREKEVLQLTAQGCSSTEIGKRLFVSRRTIETHRANLMRKLGVRNQKDLIRFAVERGLVAQEP